MNDTLLLEQKLNENVARVFDAVAVDCQRCGRDPGSIQVVAVTKYVDVTITRCLANVLQRQSVSLGVATKAGPALGESRPQLLWDKQQSWGDGPPVEWHLIGHLQSNKAKKTIGTTRLIHSIDRFELLEKLEQHAAAADATIHGLLEFNISGDPDKHGFREQDFERLSALLPTLNRLKIAGLMGMSGLGSDANTAELQFQHLAGLRQRFVEHLPAVQAQRMQELSMGMSDDRGPAIAAGSTLLRIGSAFFAGLI